MPVGCVKLVLFGGVVRTAEEEERKRKRPKLKPWFLKKVYMLA